MCYEFQDVLSDSEIKRSRNIGRNNPFLICRDCLVWGRLGALIRQEGEEPRVLEIFYRAVVQAIILYGSETWVLLASMANMVEETHTEFLQLITGKRLRRLEDETWETPRSEVVREATGTNLTRTYIER